mmetsp:Transcript_36065/g.82134  ORF Transcript_36065/g.82134 Transcript_36065/m.82134 type:complete len:448 (+) Transcript_36065:44-1387(+)
MPCASCALRVVSGLLLLFDACFGSTPPSRIAFGSCNRALVEQPFWQHIVARQPDLWVWGGDAIYGDTGALGRYGELEEVSFEGLLKVLRGKKFEAASPEQLRALYNKQLANKGYQQLMRTCPVVGTWDDHDYGIDNGDASYTFRKESQQLFLDFLQVPPGSPLRARRGVYSVHTSGPIGQRVSVILLDCRYHQNITAGVLLGEEQWEWLEETLRTSESQVHIVVSGIQVLPYRAFTENWAKFPKEQARLIRLLLSSGVPGVLLVSGDVHMAEVSSVLCTHRDSDSARQLLEVTSSGLTHSTGVRPFFLERWGFWIYMKLVPQEYQVSGYYWRPNVGEVVVDWDAGTAKSVRVNLYGEDGVKAVITAALEPNNLVRRRPLQDSDNSVWSCSPAGSHDPARDPSPTIPKDVLVLLCVAGWVVVCFLGMCLSQSLALPRRPPLAVGKKHV